MVGGQRSLYIREVFTFQRQASMELGPEYVSLLEVFSFQHFRGYRLQWSRDLKMCPY